MAEKDNQVKVGKGTKTIKSRGTGMARGTVAGTASKERVAARGKSAQRPSGMFGSADIMERRAIAAKKGRPLYGKNQPPKESETATEEDWLAALRDSGGGGGGSRRTYSDEQVAATQAKLQALYNRYAADILAQQDNINKNYAAGATNLGSAYDTAVGNINKSYDAARAEQTRQLLALGMTEQTPIQNVSAQVGDTSSLERLRAAVLAQNEASRNYAITNQRLASEAASREGAREVANVVAQMQQAMTSYGGGGGGGGLSAKDYANLRLKQMGMEQDAEIAAAKMAASSAPRQSGVQLVNNIMKQNPNLTVEQATNIAKLG